MNQNPDASILQELSHFETVDLLGNQLRDEKFDYSSLNHLAGIQSPNVFIGLGGGGTKGVALLKELFTRTFAALVPHEASSRIPDGYQFLAIDSDTTSVPSILTRGAEWIQLKGDGLGHGVYEDKIKSEFYKAWVPQDVPPRDFKTGCQGFRTLGRLLFNMNLGTVEKGIRDAINRAMNAPKLDRTDLTVYLFCTLAGGTGSGCLLDAAFLIRQAWPEARVRAVLACAEGFGSNSELLERAKSGVFFALREIDHFMSGGSMEEWLDGLNHENFPGYLGGLDPAQRGRFTMGGGVATGHLTKPFNECLLVGQSDSEGLAQALTSERLSLFMARVAFSFTAYPTLLDSKGQGFESNLNNNQQQLITEKLGCRLTYLVPGFTSFHAPVARAVELSGMRAGVTLLRDLRGGTCHKEHRDEARSFLAQQAISGEESKRWLTMKMEQDIGLNTSLLVENRKTLESSKRYNCGADLMKPFERFYGNDGYLEEANRLQENRWQEPPVENPRRKPDGSRDLDASPFTIGEKLAVFQRTLVEQCNAELRTPGRRRAALDDFLNDLLIELDAAAQEAAQEADMRLRTFEQARKAYLEGPGGNDEGGITRAKLQAVTTRDRRGLKGLLEPFEDASHAAKMSTEYEGLARAAGVSFRNLVLSRWWKQFLADLIEQVTRMQSKALKFFSASLKAERTLESLIHQRSTELHQEAEGKGDALETAFSFNLMDGAWRQRFEADENVDDPIKVQAQGDIWLKERQDKELASNANASLVRSQAPPLWRPLEVLDLADDRIFNPTGAPLDACVAQYVCDFLAPYFTSKVRWFNGSANGDGLRRVLLFNKEDRESEAEALRRQVQWLRGKCRPQWDISLNANRFDVAQAEILLLCGPQKLTGEMVNYAGLTDVNTTLTYEQGRLVFFTAALPVALAGSARLFDPLGSTCDRHVGTRVREARTTGSEHDPRKRWSAYPASWEWKDPRELVKDEGTVNESLLASLAVGRLSEWKTLDPGAKSALDKFSAGLSTLARNPKEKQPGIWITGGQSWLAPEASLAVDGNPARSLQDAPVLLGESVAAVFEKLRNDPRLEAAAKGWHHWWRANGPALFTDRERQDFLADFRIWLREQGDACDVGTLDERRWRRLHKCARAM